MTLSYETGLSKRIIGLAISVHQYLGPGLLDSAYQECLSMELKRAEIPFARQVQVPIIYRGETLECGYRLDLVVNQEIIVEIKSVASAPHPRGAGSDLSSIFETQNRTFDEFQCITPQRWNP